MQLEIDDIADVMAGLVHEATAPLIDANKALREDNDALRLRLDALESREMPDITGLCDPKAVAELIAEAAPDVASELEPLRAENEALAARITELESREIALPEPIKGDPGEVDMDAVKLMIAKEVVAAVSTLPPAEKGEPGRDADMEDITARVETLVKSAVAALPVPIDGEPGKDGLGLADALIDRDGSLVLTMTDGTTKSLGQVVGKDGVDGKDGEPGHTFTLDDFEIVPIDERSIKMGFTYGEVMHSFELEFPVPVYRGVYREGQEYDRADVTTWGGSLWHADKATSAKPDAPDSGWTLCVKRGRDGKDAAK